jgi:DnaJ domain
MAYTRDRRWQIKARRDMQKRIAEIQARTLENLDYAFDKLIQQQPDLYFTMEEGLEEVRQTVTLVGEELDSAKGLAELERLDRRIEFIEERFEDLESELFARPRRRSKRRPSLFDFFKAASGGGDGSAGSGDPLGDVRTAAEAYEILGLDSGCSPTAVTRAFRQKAKELHPDSRDGDRSGEPKLRKLIAAYQYLRSTYNTGDDNASGNS